MGGSASVSFVDVYTGFGAMGYSSSSSSSSSRAGEVVGGTTKRAVLTHATATTAAPTAMMGLGTV